MSTDPVANNTNAPGSTRPMMGFNDCARFQCTPQARLDGTTCGYSFQQFHAGPRSRHEGPPMVDAVTPT
ncbi:hypothetical protein [Arthrobacter methylotrophus]|uniref:hypothetical protein n=1 Tax=Arthrobacter methylotrophus TaxID=121291 RepID=UPI0031E6FEB9